MTAKNPRTPPRALTAQPEDFVSYDGPLWRIHRLTGQCRQQWDEMRTVGPLAQMRWDPHHDGSEGAGAVDARSVSYTATDVLTAFAEVFHSRRRIVLSRHQGLVGWIPDRPIRLLDLTPPAAPEATSWSLRNGASVSLDSAVKPTCRALPRAIADTWSDLDGLSVRSTVTGRAMVVLFAPAAASFPGAPAFSRRLDDPVVAALAVGTSNSLRWPPPIVR